MSTLRSILKKNHIVHYNFNWDGCCIFEYKKGAMVTIQIKDNSKQAKKMLEYLQTLPFVKFVEQTQYPTMDEIVDECRKSRKKIARTYNVKK
ncbi:MAG TPA: hypothetical protein VFI78_00640 [Salinimicrobium sp.]|nr:hypothetical protein [Salinimicrobium sp.]